MVQRRGLRWWVLATGLLVLASIAAFPGFARAQQSAASPVPIERVQDCRDVDPAWSAASLDLSESRKPGAPGKVYRVSDGALAVLVIAGAVSANGDATLIDFAASTSLSAAILRTADAGYLFRFDPPKLNASALSAEGDAAILSVIFCYQVEVPGPPRPGATQAPSPTATPTGEATEEIFELATIQTAAAQGTEVANLSASATAEADAAAATIAALSTAAAEQSATIAALNEGIAATASAQAAQSESAAASATAEAASASATAEAGAIAAGATAAANASAAQASAQANADATSAAQAAISTAQADALATSQAEQAALAATVSAYQTTTAPTATAIPETIYDVPAAASFDTWVGSLPGEWSVENGLLISNGSTFTGYVQPPTSTELLNYAVEVELRVAETPECGTNFGVIARGSDQGFYAGGLEWDCDNGATARLWASERELERSALSVDNEWHTYRIAVQGDRVSLTVDGATVLDTTDATFGAGGQIAIWSNGVKLEIRAFRVVNIG